jgi:hypothetical protein
MAVPTKKKRGLIPVDAAGRVHLARLPLVMATSNVDFGPQGPRNVQKCIPRFSFILLPKSRWHVAFSDRS